MEKLFLVFLIVFSIVKIISAILVSKIVKPEPKIPKEFEKYSSKEDGQDSFNF